MSLELDVLRALLRLARRRTPPTLEQLADRVHGDETAIRTTLKALASSGLVQRTPAGLRLSLAGLAVAVAHAQRPANANKTKATRMRSGAASSRTDTPPVTAIGQRRSARHRAA
jgi:DNA-binding IclR family transcriptional regulator